MRQKQFQSEKSEKEVARHVQKKALETQPIFASASETPIQSTPITMQTQVQPAKRPRGRPPKPKPTL